MNKLQSNFVLRVMKGTSPVIITVPHGGLRAESASWLDALFVKRIMPERGSANMVKGERIILSQEAQVMHITADILKECPVNLIVGLLPRAYVDYNRFVPEVAYVDPNIKPYYDAYHHEISTAIERLRKWHRTIYLFDFHGFREQPLLNKEYDIILGTNGETCPGETDKLLYSSLGNKYSIFCAGEGNNRTDEFEAYRGNTTNLHYYKKYGVEAMLVEIAPRFRSAKDPYSREYGKQLAKDFAKFFSSLV